MSLVVTMSNAFALSAMRALASVESEDLDAKDSARAMISLAEAMRASRSENAEPMTASFFWRSSRPRRSRPAMPPEDSVREFGGGAPVDGGRDGRGRLRSHLRCVMAPFRRSWKIFSPPARKENLMHSVSESWSVVLRSRLGPGESVRSMLGLEGTGGWDSADRERHHRARKRAGRGD